MTAASLLSVFISACGAEGTESPAADDWAPDEFRQWKLPGSLREISGLALTPDERLLAITDEQAIVYELDYQAGAIIKSFAFGDPIVRGDFEGIAVLENTIWLMTSDGILLAAQEGPDRRKVRYQRFDTGHGDHCELEGLAQDRPAATLILVCKEANSKKNDLMIFEWAITPGGVDHLRDVAVPERSITRALDKKRINPSGIAIDPQSGDRMLVAARQHTLVRLAADGELIETIILQQEGRHRQAEGIEITRDGRVLIADEGGDGRARLAVYPPASQGNNNNE